MGDNADESARVPASPKQRQLQRHEQASIAPGAAADAAAVARSQEWRRFQAEIAQCWIAKAIVHVFERASAMHLAQSSALLSFRPPTAAAGGEVDAFANIRAFATRFQQVHRQQGGRDGDAIDTNDFVSDVDAFRQWLHVYHERLRLEQRGTTCLVILYAPSISAAATQALQDGIVRAEEEHSTIRTIVLVIANPIGLLDVRSPAESTSSSRCFVLLDSKHDTNKPAVSYEELLVRPLKQLGAQCGWRFVLEIAASTVLKRDSESSAASLSSSTLFTSLTHLPFQLVLLVLRWSHFHPTLVTAFARPFERKLRLIPQTRIRNAISELQQDQMAIWSHLYPMEENEPLGIDLPSGRRRPQSSPSSSPSSPTIQIPTREENSASLKSLSHCQLWEVQKQFYLQQGIKAWSNGIIPFGVSSSSFLAASYARIAADFFLEAASAESNTPPSGKLTDPTGSPNCFVWEAASGSCKFLHAFLVHFFAIVDTEYDFARRRLVPCVIASDLSDRVLDSRMEMTCFAPFLAKRQLEFARFDTETFIRGDSKKTLFWRYSKQTWQVGSNGPVFLMGNYFLDSLRTDVFAVTRPPAPTEEETATPLSCQERLKVYEGRVDREITSIVDMELSFQQIDPFSNAVYDGDQLLNDVLADILEAIDASPAHTLSSLILFPVEAIHFIRTLVENDTSGGTTANAETPTAPKSPFGMLIGDASFSFRDPISSAFFNDENGNELEIPQLSPHPDCFCLPVDFEILRIFFQRLTQSVASSSSTQVASAIATDTFDVFYGSTARQRSPETSPPLLQASTSLTAAPAQVGFAQAFASFTPSDCDLLWGMMGVDNGANHFSMKTQLALLAQSAWDFDLFVILQWKLMRFWRAYQRQRQVHADPGVLRMRLIAIGIASWNTYYVLDGEKEDISKAFSLLQLSRWLYGASPCPSRHFVAADIVLMV